MLCENPLLHGSLDTLLPRGPLDKLRLSNASRHDAQLDLLARLRIVEQLQGISPPHPVHQPQDDHIIDMLNWIALFFSPNETGDSVSVAFSAETGHVTLYVSHHEDGPTTEQAKSTARQFVSSVRRILTNEIASDVASRMFFRMIVDMSYERIMRKIYMVAQTEEGAGQTTHHFTSLVSVWLLFRPEGETSNGLVSMAKSYVGDPRLANEYLVQSFFTIANQTPAILSAINAAERYSYLSSIITACSLLISSTFFHDIVNHAAFRLSLKSQDRTFLHKVIRRVSRVAAYKTGSMQFGYLGIPFMRSVIGDKPTAGGIDVVLVSDPPIMEGPLSATYQWPYSPAEHIPLLFPEKTIPDGHSRTSTDDSIGSSSSSRTSSSHSCTSELSRLDGDLRAELLQSDLMATTWVKGGDVHVRIHPELQLVHYLMKHAVDVVYMAIGTSKPACWACGAYLDHMTMDMVEEGSKWWYTGNRNKVYHQWMIPPEAPERVVTGLLEDAQLNMERVVEDVALDCYY